MIGHIETGSNFNGLFGYLLGQEKGARIIGGNVAGETSKELTIEFNNCADLRRTTTKPVKHLMISFAPEDGFVRDEIKARIGEVVVNQLGYNYNQYVIIDHDRQDPGHDWQHDHDHIHLVVNQITLDGQRINDSWEYGKFETILREQEIGENLKSIVSSKYRQQSNPSHGQIQRFKREKKEYEMGLRKEVPQVPISQQLQQLIKIQSEDRPSIIMLIARLQQSGIEVRINLTETGQIQGISYGLNGVCFRGSYLHDCSFPKLIKKRGIKYDEELDLPILQALAKGEKIDLNISDLPLTRLNQKPAIVKSQQIEL